MVHIVYSTYMMVGLIQIIGYPGTLFRYIHMVGCAGDNLLTDRDDTPEKLPRHPQNQESCCKFLLCHRIHTLLHMTGSSEIRKVKMSWVQKVKRKQQQTSFSWLSLGISRLSEVDWWKVKMSVHLYRENGSLLFILSWVPV